MFSDEAFKSDCKEDINGAQYKGHIDATVSGKLCQPWRSQFPHEHALTTADHFSDESLKDAENFCRNPFGLAHAPFCYTADENTSWEYCDVPICPR